MTAPAPNPGEHVGRLLYQLLKCCNAYCRMPAMDRLFRIGAS